MATKAAFTARAKAMFCRITRSARREWWASQASFERSALIRAM
jgi:hypothetical protein